MEYSDSYYYKYNKYYDVEHKLNTNVTSRVPIITLTLIYHPRFL
jgi:hypothetical protein